MKTLQQIKDEYAIESGRENWEDKLNFGYSGDSIWNSDVDEIAKRYARQCCKATQLKIADKISALDGTRDEVYDIITNKENIVLWR